MSDVIDYGPLMAFVPARKRLAPWRLMSGSLEWSDEVDGFPEDSAFIVDNLRLIAIDVEVLRRDSDSSIIGWEWDDLNGHHQHPATCSSPPDAARYLRD